MHPQSCQGNLMASTTASPPPGPQLHSKLSPLRQQGVRSWSRTLVGKGDPAIWKACPSDGRGSQNRGSPSPDVKSSDSGASVCPSVRWMKSRVGAPAFTPQLPWVILRGGGHEDW